MSDASDYPMYIDRRDAAVIEHFEEGEVARARQLQRMYKRYTDIRQDSTAKQRKDNLFNSPCMEYTGTPGSFIFVGFDNE